MREWLEYEFGIAPWVFEGVFPPLLAVVFVFLVRELVLAYYRRTVDDPARRTLWRRRTLWIALPVALICAVVAIELGQRGLALGASEKSTVLGGHLGSITRAIAYTTLFVTFWLVVNRTYRNLASRIDAWKAAAEGVKVQGAVLLSPDRVRTTLHAALRLLKTLFLLALLYLYVPLILSAIPWTHHLAGQVMPYAMAPVVTAGKAILAYLPDLITLTVILVVGRYVLRLLRFSMVAIGSGALTVEGFEPEWAEPTYKLGRMSIVLVLLMVSYPYLPGSGSDVFKGFSLFLGALVTLGASSSIANVIAGVILTYTGSFRVGDRVHVGDTVGDVLEKKLFVTRLRTIYNEEVTVPNSLVMQKRIINYTTSSQKGGLALTIEAGIGYDVDWRRVHELMKKAARDCEQILDDPEPFVLQNGLGDFAVQYKLVAFTDDAKSVIKTVSELRQRALDAFNEAGLEIMTPLVHAVRNQPELTTPRRDAEDHGSLRFASISGSRD